MSRSTLRTTITGDVSNGTEVGGRMIDAEMAPSSWLVMPKSLMAPLPRQVMADTHPRLSSSQVLQSSTQQLLRGRGFTRNLST